MAEVYEQNLWHGGALIFKGDDDNKVCATPSKHKDFTGVIISDDPWANGKPTESKTSDNHRMELLNKRVDQAKYAVTINSVPNFYTANTPFAFVSNKSREMYNNEAPKYATLQSAGFDLRALEVDASFDKLGLRYRYRYATQTDMMKAPTEIAGYTLLPGRKTLIKTGLKFQIPTGYCLMITPRSGLALNHGITIINSPGIIDADYRGEIGVILLNTSGEEFNFKPGDKIAQAVLVQAPQCIFNELSLVDFDKNTTERGSGGFGSTGK